MFGLNMVSLISNMTYERWFIISGTFNSNMNDD
jgi:hypothetical protein